MYKKHQVPPHVRVVEDRQQLKKIWLFRKQEYSGLYPDVSVFENDPFDEQAVVLFTQSETGEVTSTARLVFDSALGLPEEALVQDLLRDQRSRGLKIAELGRFIITKAAQDVLKAYYRAFYSTAIKHDVDSIVMVMKQKDVRLHQRTMGVRILASSLGVTFGSSHDYACVEWQIGRTKPAFITWCGLDMVTEEGEESS